MLGTLGELGSQQTAVTQWGEELDGPLKSWSVDRAEGCLRPV
jgi:hypothetical protein